MQKFGGARSRRRIRKFCAGKGAQSKRFFMQALNKKMSERSRSFIHPAGRNVELFNEIVFSALRAMASVPDDFINDGWDFSTFQHGGGKGGSMMAFVEDKFIIKELSPGDHKSLLELAPAYGRHVNRGITTLLSPIYLHFRDEESGKFYFAMKNTIGKGPFKVCYDLKGCADDKLMEKSGERVKAVHKRIWNVGMWCGQRNWTEERKRYYAGKLEARSVQIGLLQEQRQNLLDALKRDTDFLAGHKLMDYSFLVAIKESPPGSTSSNHLQPFRYLRSDGKEIAVYVAIIDFLQIWTAGKRIARCIKVCERNKATIPPKSYAGRFVKHFSEHVIEVDEEAAPDPLDSDFVEVPLEVQSIRAQRTLYNNSNRRKGK